MTIAKTLYTAILLAMLVFPAQADALPHGHGSTVSFTNSCGYETIGYHHTGATNGERYSQVVISTVRYVVYHLQFVANPGDILRVHGDSEVTTERDTWTEFTTVFRLFHSAGAVDMSEENGTNISLGQHHWKVSQSGFTEVPEDHTPGGTVTVSWMWHAADGSQTPQYLWVGCGATCWNDYGAVFVTQTRPRAC